MITIKCFECGETLGKTKIGIEELKTRTVIKGKPILCNHDKCNMTWEHSKQRGLIQHHNKLERAWKKYYEEK